MLLGCPLGELLLLGEELGSMLGAALKLGLPLGCPLGEALRLGLLLGSELGVVLGAILIQLALGAIYAWSVFTPTLNAAGWSKFQTQAVFAPLSLRRL